MSDTLPDDGERSSDCGGPLRDGPILPETAAGRAVMDVIDAVLNEDDMPCGFDYDHAAVAAIDVDR